MDTSTWHNMLSLHVHYKLKAMYNNNKTKKNLCLGSTKICWASRAVMGKKREREADCMYSCTVCKEGPHQEFRTTKAEATWVYQFQPNYNMISGTCVLKQLRIEANSLDN